MLVGIVTTAEKRGLADPDHLEVVLASMKKLNDLGIWLSKKKYVNCLTDVTGFGLLGHLSEICEAANLSAEINFTAVPKFNFLDNYIHQGCIPGGTNRNWESYGEKISIEGEIHKLILADPQTSGGLLISIDGDSISKFQHELRETGSELIQIGRLPASKEKLVYVK